MLDLPELPIDPGDHKLHLVAQPPAPPTEVPHPRFLDPEPELGRGVPERRDIIQRHCPELKLAHRCLLRLDGRDGVLPGPEHWIQVSAVSFLPGAQDHDRYSGRPERRHPDGEQSTVDGVHERPGPGDGGVPAGLDVDDTVQGVDVEQ